MIFKNRFSRLYKLAFIVTLALVLIGCSETKDESVSKVERIEARSWHERATSEIVGRVSFEGRPPIPAMIRMTGDQACHHGGAEEHREEEILTHGDSTLLNVFVYISDGIDSQNFPVPEDSVMLDQKGCRYIPHVFGIRVGQPLAILNSDPTLHNVYAASKRNPPFNLGMTRKVKRLTRMFNQPEVMIPIRCNVHPWMSAYAGVVDHPFYHVINQTGQYRFGLLPAGEYMITAWHEKLGRLEKRISLKDNETREVNFKLSLN